MIRIPKGTKIIESLHGDPERLVEDVYLNPACVRAVKNTGTLLTVYLSAETRAQFGVLFISDHTAADWLRALRELREWLATGNQDFATLTHQE